MFKILGYSKKMQIASAYPLHYLRKVGGGANGRSYKSLYKSAVDTCGYITYRVCQIDMETIVACN